MSQLDQQIADMRQAATILRTLGVGEYARLVEEVSVAAAHSRGEFVSVAETMRWTPTVCVAAELSRQIIAATGADPASRPHVLGIAT